MRMRTWWFMVAMVTVVLPIGGCNLMTPEQKLGAVDKAIAGLEVQRSLLMAGLRDPNVPAEHRAKLEAARTTVDGLIADFQSARTDLQAGKDVNIAALLGIAATILSTSGQALGGPVGGWLQLAAAILIAILSAIPGLAVAVKRGYQVKAAAAETSRAHSETDSARSVSLKTQLEAKEAMRGMVASVNKLLSDAMVVPDAEAAKSVLAREQVKSPEAARAVREILEEQSAVRG